MIRRLPLTVLAALAALAVVVPSAQAARGMEIGIQDDEVFVQQNLLSPSRGYLLASQLGASRLVINLGWAGAVGETRKDTARPNPVPYNWGPVDRAIDEAAANGLRTQLKLLGPVPAWASGRRKESNISPNPRLFAQFARDAAAHFRGRVDRYSIWNEPNYSSWLLPHVKAPQLYRELYQGAYKGIKSADPGAMVLIGELSPLGFTGRSDSPLKFLRAVTCSKPNYEAARSCPPLPADGFAHHPYTIDFRPNYAGLGRDDVTTGSLVRLEAALEKLQARQAIIGPNGNRPLDIYGTEYGFLARGRRSFPENQRGAYLRKGFLLAERNPRVKLMTQYLLAAQSPINSFDSSLLNPQGQPGMAFNALSAYAQQALAEGRVKRPVPFALPPAPPGP